MDKVGYSSMMVAIKTQTTPKDLQVIVGFCSIVLISTLLTVLLFGYRVYDSN
jgi:hypothetical protein